MASDNATAPTPAAAPPTLRIFAGADSFGCNVKDALVAHLRSLPGIEIVDLGTDKYYSIAEQIGCRVSADGNTTSPETRGLLACGTGIGVSIFANKFPRVYASTCTSVDDAVNTRSINNCNVLSLSGMSTSPENALKILDAWLQTPFKSPCPASGDKPWPDEIESFLNNSTSEMAKIPNSSSSNCAICCLRKGLEFEPVGIMPGAEMKIVRESPTSAIVKFKAGSMEPAHHHTFGHDVLVMKGRKKVWNLDKKESYELSEGDYLFTPAGDKHRVKYFEDTEFFIRWDGDWDIFLDENLEAAADAIKVELQGSEAIYRTGRWSIAEFQISFGQQLGEAKAAPFHFIPNSHISSLPSQVCNPSSLHMAALPYPSSKSKIPYLLHSHSHHSLIFTQHFIWTAKPKLHLLLKTIHAYIISHRKQHPHFIFSAAIDFKTKN